MENPTLIDFEAGMDPDQAKEALRRWEQHDKLLQALQKADNMIYDSLDGQHHFEGVIAEAKATL